MPPQKGTNTRGHTGTPSSKSKSKSGSFWLNFLTGGFAAVISKSICAPLERTKLILQTEAMSSAMRKGQPQQYSGIVDCITKVVKYEGFRTLWKGNGINIIRYFPMSAINFSLKEKFTHYTIP